MPHYRNTAEPQYTKVMATTRYSSGNSHELRVRLTDEEYEGVRWAATFTNTTMNQVVSTAINQYLSTTGAYRLAATASTIEQEHADVIKRLGGADGK